MLNATITFTNANVLLILIAGVVLMKFIIDLEVASYGRTKGYPFFPVLIGSVFLGFPLVLLVVAVASTHRSHQNELEPIPVEPAERPVERLAFAE